MSEKDKDETTSFNGEVVWGILEELLLTCAVNRYGTDNWDTVSGELRKRMNHPFSPDNCQQKYRDLKHRFSAAGTTVDGDGDITGEAGFIIDELRKLRIEKLKQEVERHDISIASLEVKVKKLEVEKKEKSTSKVEEEPETVSDLRDELTGKDTGEKSDKPGYSPEKLVSGDSVGDRSFAGESKPKVEPEGKGENTSTEPGSVRSRVEPGKDGGGSGSQSGRPVESKKSSEVQSSTSLSRKKRRRFRGESSGDEVEEVSPVNKRMKIKSQPLILFLEKIIHSHKHGSVFHRRLPSQETEKYRNVIRQHMDLDTVQSRLDKGIYNDCHPKFYRDLLLTFTNAILFYRKSTAEHIAARELRKLVLEEIAQWTEKSNNKAQFLKPDLEPQHLDPIVKKPRSSSTMVVCRRRSSTSMQALSDSIQKSNANHATNANNSTSKVDNEREEKAKPLHHEKKVDGSNSSGSGVASRKVKEEEKDALATTPPTTTKKVLTKERSSLGRGALRLSNSKKIISKEGSNREKMGESKCSNNSKKKEESSEGAETVETRKKVNSGEEKQEKGRTGLKKEGVANFLRRMKQNSPTSQEKVKKKASHDSEEEEEDEEDGSKDKNKNQNKETKVKVANRVKKGGGNANGIRRQEKEEVVSRGTRRPPKRKAAMMSDNGNGNSNDTPDSSKGARSKKNPRR